MPRPGLRRLDSRTQDPSIRRVDRTPRITVERRPSSRAPRERNVRQPPAPSSRPSRSVRMDGASCSCPLSAAPRASPSFTTGSPRRAPVAGPRRRYVEPSTSPTPHEAGWRPLPSRSAATPPVAGSAAARLALASRATGPAPSRGAGRWWAPLLPGGPTLMGFRSSSNQLERASERRRWAHTSFGPEVLRTLPLGPDAPSPGRPRSS